MSRKRNVGLRFFERLSEFATTRLHHTTRNPLFFEQFRVKLAAIPLLAQALSRTNTENCIVVREVCYLARSIILRARIAALSTMAIMVLQKFSLK